MNEKMSLWTLSIFITIIFLASANFFTAAAKKKGDQKPKWAPPVLHPRVAPDEGGNFSSSTTTSSDPDDYNDYKGLDSEYRLISKWRRRKLSVSAARPRRHFTDVVDVSVAFGLLQINQVQEDLNLAIIHGWTLMMWTDDYHKWNASEYGGLTTVSVAADLVWKPDVVQYSAASQTTAVNIFAHTNVNVYSTGLVIWAPPTTLHVPFRYSVNDSASWPYDRHLIRFKLGTWSQGTNTINLRAANATDILGGVADSHEFVEGTRWRLLDFRGYAQAESFECCPGTRIPMVTFEIELERKSNFLIHLIGYPLKLVLFSSCAVFALPVAALPLRLLVCVMYFLVYSVLLHVLQSIMPAGAVYGPSVPLPVAAVVSAIALMLADVYVIVVIGLAARVNKYAFPTWARSALHGLAAALCLDPRRTVSSDDGEYESAVVGSYHRMTNEDAVGSPRRPVTPIMTGGAATAAIANGAAAAGNGGSAIMMSSLPTVAATTAMKPGGAVTTLDIKYSDWKLLAAVLNRFAFIVNLVVCIAIAVASP